MEGNFRSGLRFAVGAMPRLPESAAARSERMSACRLVATSTSSVCGFSTMRVVTASTSSRSNCPSREALRDWKAQSPEGYVVRHALVADGAKEDCVERLQPLEATFRDVIPLLQIVIGAPREVLRPDPEVPLARRRLEHLQAGPDHFR